MKSLIAFFGLCGLIVVSTSTVLIGQDEANEEPKSADEIAKEMSNPIGSLASLTLQGTYAGWDGSIDGASSQNTSTLIFMPTIPFKLRTGSITVRPSFPVSAAPVIDEQGNWDKKRGFGDIGIMALYGINYESGFLWGAGPTMFFPTASNSYVGKDQFQVGPAALAGILKKWGVVGILWQHWWGMGSLDEGESRSNVGTMQLFYWFSAGNGWQIGGSPVQTANYVEAQDIDFSIPLNLGVAKTLMLGKMPLKCTVQGQYFVTRPDLVGPSWGVFFQITPVVRLPW